MSVANGERMEVGPKRGSRKDGIQNRSVANRIITTWDSVISVNPSEIHLTHQVCTRGLLFILLVTSTG